MDLLYRIGGLSGAEIGEIMGVDYSTVSMGGNDYGKKLKSDKHFSLIIKRVENEATYKTKKPMTFLSIMGFSVLQNSFYKNRIIA
ncbi:MAG TPA: hypothetical protein ACFYDZ_03480 [Candidatus Brocadiaceae bacterium]